jgi:hypothetical protein
LGTLTGCEIILTDIVWSEATRKATVGPAAARILAGISFVRRHDFLPNATETRVFAALRAHYPEAKYHDGELSVIALSASNEQLVPVIFERRGLVAACDELRRQVLTGHWFFSELQQKHGLAADVFKKCVAILDSKSYPTPTWFGT